MEKYIFSNENIAQVCGQVWESMKTFDVERREGLRLKLVLEEVLLEYQEKFGEKAEFFVRCIKRFSTIKIEVIVKGESFLHLRKSHSLVL